MKVAGTVWFIFRLEFDLDEWSVRAVEEHWSWRKFKFLAKLFMTKDGEMIAPSVYIHSNDPTVQRDCLSILCEPEIME